MAHDKWRNVGPCLLCGAKSCPPTQRPRIRVADRRESVDDIHSDIVVPTARTNQDLPVRFRGSDCNQSQIAQESSQKDRVALNLSTCPSNADIYALGYGLLLAIPPNLSKQISKIDRMDCQSALFMGPEQRFPQKGKVFSDPVQSVFASLKKIDILDAPYPQSKTLEAVLHGQKWLPQIMSRGREEEFFKAQIRQLLVLAGAALLLEASVRQCKFTGAPEHDSFSLRIVPIASCRKESPISLGKASLT